MITNGCVIFGSHSGWSGVNDTSLLMDLVHGFQVYGYGAGGISPNVASVGDVNGDGYADMAMCSTVNTQTIFLSGGAFSVNGFNVNCENGSYFPTGLAPLNMSFVGDFNGDGLSDILIANCLNYNSTAPQIYYGRASWLPTTTTGYTSFSDFPDGCVGGGGDFNGDGLADVVLGAYSSNTGTVGRVSVYLGQRNVGSTISVPAVTWRGSNPSDFIVGLGSKLTSGDFNGDGIDDLVMQSNSDTYVVFGKRSGFGGVSPSALNGSDGFVIRGAKGDLSGRGDFNGDGYDDLLVGASGYNYILYGKAIWSASVNLSSIDLNTGLVLSGGGDTYGGYVGDVNGDGLDDIIVEKGPKAVCV